MQYQGEFPHPVTNIYEFGSRVYGSNDENSDSDFIMVCTSEFYKEQIQGKETDINVHWYTVEQFQGLLNNHDIQMLECFFLPDRFIKRENVLFNFKLDKQKLRTSISTITSNSWVKGKKKLIVTGDYDQRIALKSIFHSLRILDFGIQIAEYGNIVNYSSMNYILTDLKKMSESYQRLELWEAIDQKYRSLFNKLSSHFKTLCPKDLSEQDRKLRIKNLLWKYDIENEDLLMELINI